MFFTIIKLKHSFNKELHVNLYLQNFNPFYFSIVILVENLEVHFGITLHIELTMSTVKAKS